jgi:predicted nucleic acid-binding protein
MTDITFVDTGAWFAGIVPTDPNYFRAKSWLESNNSFLLTSDYIIDETLTLLRARGEKKRAMELGEEFFLGNLAEIYRLTDEDFVTTWQTFRDFNDKNWSFTDCASKVVIEKLGITQAFVFDHHFKQFGNVIIVPI